jgi:hypothetical protein
MEDSQEESEMLQYLAYQQQIQEREFLEEINEELLKCQN